MLSDWISRRAAVLEGMVDNSIALICGNSIHYRNSDSEYPFRQDSYFYYLTGFNEANAFALLIKQAVPQFILFCQQVDADKARWQGASVDLQQACALYGADAAFDCNTLEAQLLNYLPDKTAIYYLFNQDERLTQLLSRSLRQVQSQRQALPGQFFDLRRIVDELRLIKQAAELQLLKKACAISAEAHCAAMQHTQVGMYEYQIEALLLYEFYRQGARHVAYPSIVAAGSNACILHYHDNQALLKDNQLLLIDAGAEYESYAADITRTFPINKKFTAPQQALYEVVLAAQLAAIAEVKIGNLWKNLQDKIVDTLLQGLVDLKILQGSLDSLREQKAHLPFYMHGSGHWLGLDVHDVGSYQVAKKTRPLQANMVFTIEPGLYIAPSDLKVAEKWRGIGIRIEDDILLTATNQVDVLSAGVPKTVAEIEKLMA